jgi:hypothetical protein
MNASRFPYLLLILVTGWFGASAVQATDPVSPIGFWKGQDGTFEMFESEGKLSARIVALNEPKTAESELRSATAFPTRFPVSRHTRKQR